MTDLGRWYQTATINGAAMPCKRRGESHDYRWQTIVGPLVPPDGAGRLFVELGCNAGFYLRHARALGYRALGIEKDPTYAAQARYWEQADPRSVEIVESDMMDYDIPACHVALVACVHYWQREHVLRELFRRLRKRAMAVIVMGKHRGRAVYPPDREHLLPLLADWEIVRETSNRTHYAVLARSPVLYELGVKKLYADLLAYTVTVPTAHHEFFPAFEDFVRRELSGQRFNVQGTRFWRYLVDRRFRYLPALVFWWRHMVHQIADSGRVDWPLDLHPNGVVRDGHHRLVVAHVLGIERVICRWVPQ